MLHPHASFISKNGNGNSHNKTDNNFSRRQQNSNMEMFMTLAIWIQPQLCEMNYIDVYIHAKNPHRLYYSWHSFPKVWCGWARDVLTEILGTQNTDPSGLHWHYGKTVRWLILFLTKRSNSFSLSTIHPSLYSHAINLTSSSHSSIFLPSIQSSVHIQVEL